MSKQIRNVSVSVVVEYDDGTDETFADYINQRAGVRSLSVTETVLQLIDNSVTSTITVSWVSQSEDDS